MRFFFFIILSIVPLCLPAQQIEALLTAEKALAEGDTTSAVIVFKEVLRNYPDSYTAALRLTEVHYQHRLYGEAIQYSHITEDVLLRKLDSLAVQKDKAPDDSARSITYKSDLASLYHFKGKIRLKQHRGPDALEELDRALSYGGDSAAIFLDKGLVLLELNDLRKARKNFRLSMEYAPGRAGAPFNLGNTFYNEGQYDSASFYYEKTIKADPSFIWAYAYLGEINTRRKNYGEAIGNYSDYLDLKLSEEILFKRAVLYAELRQWELSLDDWDSVLILNPDNSDAMRNRGLSHFQLQDYKKAIRDFSNALTLDQDPYTYINRGYSYYLSGDSKSAIEDYNKGLPDLPDYSLGYYLRALAYKDRKKKRQSCSDLSQAMELGMTESDIDKELLGYCY
jgi:tetratricopeptide (TPR) repeat protein